MYYKIINYIYIPISRVPHIFLSSLDNASRYAMTLLVSSSNIYDLILSNPVPSSSS